MFGLLFLVSLSATLGLTYFESRDTIIELAKEKAISIIRTIDSALESNIPDYQFENVLLHLKGQDPDLISFDIYKLNGFLYDIASTVPQRIGTQANSQSEVAVYQHHLISFLQGNVLDIIAPIKGYGGNVYSANVKFSIAQDMRSTKVLLTEVLLIGLAAMILTILAVWFFTRELLSKPVLAVVSAANDVAAGNLQIDLSQSERRQDEIGSLARSFKRMTESLQQMMTRMAQTADELNQEFEGLVANGDYTARAALHVSDVMHHVTQTVTEQMQVLKGLKERSESFEHGSIRGELEDQLEETRDLSAFLQVAIDLARETAVHLEAVSSMTQEQLGAVEEVNRSAARLSQMASELRNLILAFEV